MGVRRPADLPASSCRARHGAPARVLTVSERTKRDLVELYGVDPASGSSSRRTASTRRSAPASDGGRRRTCSSSARSRRGRTRSPRPRRPPSVGHAARRRRARARRRRSPRELERRGADLRGYVPKDELAELYRGAACARAAVAVRGLRAAGARGDGLRHAGRRRAGRRRCARSPATPPSSRSRPTSPTAIRQALADRDRLVAAGLERARPFSWEETARRTLDVYREVLGLREGLGDRRLARPPRGARATSLPALAAAGRRGGRDREPPGQRPRGPARRARDRAAAAAQLRRQRQRGHRRDDRRARARRQPGHGGRAGRRRGAARLPGRASALRRRRPAAARPGRHLAAVAPPLPHRRRHARPADAAPARCSRRSSASATTTSSTSARPSPSRPTGCSAASCCCAGRCSTSSAASTRASACTARRSTSATALAKAGWERWYVPAAVVRHRWDALTDQRFLTRRTLWHWRGIVRFVRKHPETSARVADESSRLSLRIGTTARVTDTAPLRPVSSSTRAEGRRPTQ